VISHIKLVEPIGWRFIFDIFVFAAIIIVIAIWFDARRLMLGIVSGYVIGFIIGMLFNVQYMDSSGYELVDSYWILWTVTMQFLAFLGLAWEVIMRIRKRKRAQSIDALPNKMDTTDS